MGWLDLAVFGFVVAFLADHPIGHPPYVLNQGGEDAGVSTVSGAGRYVFFYGEFAGTAVGFAGSAYRSVAGGGANDETGAAVSYRCLGGAAGSYALRLDVTAGRRRFFQPLEGDQDSFRAENPCYRASVESSHD